MNAVDGRTVSRLDERAQLLGAGEFLGVSVVDFEKGGRDQLSYLLRAGLTPDSTVCDIGCGVLRAGYWLIHLLNPGCYCGIEPHVGRLEMGVTTILEPGLVDAKRPRFDSNARFDTSVFGTTFDYFLAYSIWTHASKQQIETMLDAFLRDSTHHGIFLTTYLPADWRHKDSQENLWRGTSHESSTPGCVYHDFKWIQRECARRSLAVTQLGPDAITQCWLEIRRSGTPRASPTRLNYHLWMRRHLNALVEILVSLRGSYRHWRSS